MSRDSFGNLQPFLSVLIIIVSLFTLVFLQMEVRRIGYTVLKQTREYKSLQDQHRLKVMRLARITNPERLRAMAVSRLTLSEARTGQIIHMSGDKIALRQ